MFMPTNLCDGKKGERDSEIHVLLEEQRRKPSRLLRGFGRHLYRNLIDLGGREKILLGRCRLCLAISMDICD